MKSFFGSLIERFNKPLPPAVKQFIFGLYGLLVTTLFTDAVQSNPVLFYRGSIALIVVHLLLELIFPNDRNQLPPPPPMPTRSATKVVPPSRPAAPVLGGLFLLATLVSSCATFRRCEEKFVTRTIRDTTTVQELVSVTIPRDSAVLVVHTDTTHLVERVRQGRATVTITRQPINTTILAECDSARRDTVVYHRVQRNVMQVGVAPWYGWAFWASAGAALVLGITSLVLYRSQAKYRSFVREVLKA